MLIFWELAIVFTARASLSSILESFGAAAASPHTFNFSWFAKEIEQRWDSYKI